MEPSDEAVQAAMQAWYEGTAEPFTPEERDDMRAALAAALPIIRREIAEEIREYAEAQLFDGEHDWALPGYEQAFDIADHIARGGVSRCRDRELAELRAKIAALTKIATSAVEVHAHVVMDTPEDRELHDRAVATLRDAIAAASGSAPTGQEER